MAVSKGMEANLPEQFQPKSTAKEGKNHRENDNARSALR